MVFPHHYPTDSTYWAFVGDAQLYNLLKIWIVCIVLILLEAHEEAVISLINKKCNLFFCCCFFIFSKILQILFKDSLQIFSKDFSGYFEWYLWRSLKFIEVPLKNLYQILHLLFIFLSLLREQTSNCNELWTQSKMYVMLTFGNTQKHYFLKGSLMKSYGMVRWFEPPPLFKVPTPWPSLPSPFLKSFFSLPSFLFHPLLRYSRQFPPTLTQPPTALIWSTNLS